jgi:hypothetical protein
MSEKRLFQLRKYPKGATIPNVYFSNKSAAKAARNEMGGTTVVSLGPDHRNYMTTRDMT